MSSPRTIEQWLAEGVCPRGHSLYSHGDLHVHRGGGVECARCLAEMQAERHNLALAAMERRAAGRTR